MTLEEKQARDAAIQGLNLLPPHVSVEKGGPNERPRVVVCQLDSLGVVRYKSAAGLSLKLTYNHTPNDQLLPPDLLFHIQWRSGHQSPS